jgi:hypothetical protein
MLILTLTSIANLLSLMPPKSLVSISAPIALAKSAPPSASIITYMFFNALYVVTNAE